MHCKKLFEGLNKRLDEKKSIEEIRIELCPEISKGREKICHLIKMDRGQQFMIDNYDWLGYHIENIRNPDGISGTKEKEPTAPKTLQKVSMNTRPCTDDEIKEMVTTLTDIYDKLNKLEDQISSTTLCRFTWKVKEAGKRIKELRMFIRGK